MSLSKHQDQLIKIKNQFKKEEKVHLKLPQKFVFRDHDIYNFDQCLSFFDWGLKNRHVEIDFTDCTSANYQSLALVVAYAWKLKNQGCTISFIGDKGVNGASAMWRIMGARGLFQVAVNSGQNFKSSEKKPLLAIRNSTDLQNAIAVAEEYTNNFNVEYKQTLRYVLSELLYNTYEHGESHFFHKGKEKRVPSLLHFNWYQKTNEIHFVIADTGVGIKKHLEQSYPGQESDLEAIKQAIKPQVSGTFSVRDQYKNKDNAGVGLFLSSNIIRKLKANMYIISGSGVLHISPRDNTGTNLQNIWPGTFVLVAIKLEQNAEFIFYKMMQEFREQALNEQMKGDRVEEKEKFYMSISNHFGRYAIDKESAIRFRDNRLFPEVYAGKSVIVDFTDVESAPHSFLSGLFASPIKHLGMIAYKKIKFVNATPEIRETIDFIMDENTES